MTYINKRKDAGMKMSLVGIVINLILFIGKLISGLVAGSVAMTADAINNLSDFASAIVILISFYFSSRPSDREHPFGHARFEYVASAIVSMIIVFLGFQLGFSSIRKIINPVLINPDIFFYLVLIVSIILKSYLYVRYRREAKKLDSPVLLASAKDSLTDVIASSSLLIAILIGQITNKSVDGYAGIVVSIFIVYTGISILFKTSNRLLGVKADKKFRNKIKEFILDFDGIYGIHDLIIHDYGGQNYFASAHVEVNAAHDIKLIHELIDHIEREIDFKFKIQMVLHMDPIDLNDHKTERIEAKLLEIIKQIDDNISMHDLRIMEDKNRDKLIFDLKAHSGCKLTNQEIRQKIADKMEQIAPKYACYIDIDRNYEVDTVKVPFDPELTDQLQNENN